MKLSIIIPVQSLKKTKNTRFFYKPLFGIEQTLNSISSNIKGITYEIVMVINGEKDSELTQFVKNNNLITRSAFLTENVGVARAWNIGAQMSVGDYLCFCNDDVEFNINSINKLLNVFEENEKVGQVGPEGGKWEGVRSGERVGISKIEKADEISGYFFIIPSEIYYKTGGFDIEYSPAGCEEIDMSFKIRQLGYSCLVVPNTGIVHHGYHGISLRNTDIYFFGKKINTLELDKKNKLYFLKKWYNK